MSGLKEPEPSTGGIRLDEGALGGGGLRADTPLTSGNAAATAPMAFGFSAAELQDAEVMMRRKLWRDTAAKLGFAERRVELMAETIDPVAVHTAIREFVSRKKVLEGKGANFAHLKQLRAYPEFNKWYEQLATFERMEPGAARAALAGYMQAEIRQWLATRAREFYDNDGQIDAGEWSLLVRDAELFWLVEGVAAKEAQTACRVAAGDSLWAPPPPDASAELRARELRQELEARETVLREEAQRQAQASAALEEQTLALHAMERKAAEMMAQAASATEGAERKAAEVLAQAASAIEVAPSPHIPEAPAATSSKREKGSSAAWRNGLVVAGVTVVGVLGAMAYSKSEKPSSVDTKTVAEAKTPADTKTVAEDPSADAETTNITTKIPTNAKTTANTDPKCKPGSGMNSVPAGTFTMGSLSGEDDEKPPHEVTVAAFCLDVTEVTMSAYKTCVDAEACKPAHENAFVEGMDAAELAASSKACNQKQAGREAHPVNCVDWEQATAYCAAQKKRLPTEEEWEYAARGGSEQRLYPWGIAVPDATLLNACGSECEFAVKMYPTADGYATTAPVGMFPKGDGRWGHHDLAGNVWEWTSSGYSKDYTVERSTADRVFRGGSWNNGNPYLVRSAFRGKSLPSDQGGNLGFRCAGSFFP